VKTPVLTDRQQRAQALACGVVQAETGPVFTEPANCFKLPFGTIGAACRAEIGVKAAGSTRFFYVRPLSQ